MFYRDGILERSAMLSHASVAHGFSTRFGGVSTHPYTVSMNLAMGREDPDSVVRENMERFARAVTGLSRIHISYPRAAVRYRGRRWKVRSGRRVRKTNRVFMV